MAASEEWSPTMDATEETQKICDKVKPDVEKRTGKTYLEYKAVKYRNQLSEDLQNFIIKVHVGGEIGKGYIHLYPFQTTCYEMDIPHLVTVLLGVMQNKTKEDPLIPLPNHSNLFQQ